MIMFRLILAIMCLCTFVTCDEHTDICHYVMDSTCTMKTVDYADTFLRHLKPCTRKDIPKDVTFTVMEHNGTASHGVVGVEFQAPELVCEYKMLLYMNPKIKNSEDCSKFLFESNKEDVVIHSFEKNLCFTEPSSCRGNSLRFYYQYIYTGCYAAAFEVELQHIFMKQEFLKTEYNKTDVTEAIYRCNYKSIPKGNGSSTESISLSTDVSLLAGPAGLKFEIVPASPLFAIEGDTNLCNRDESPIITHRFSMSVKNNISDQICSVATSTAATGQEVKNVECKFALNDVPVDRGYCLRIRILDSRCQKSTVWNPPKSEDMSFPCAWKQYCDKLAHKAAIIEDVKKTYDQNLAIPGTFYLILLVVVVTVVVAVLIVVLFLYRRRAKRMHANSMNNNKSKSFDEDGSTTLELNGSKSQKEKLVKESGIVLLYVKESDQFMNLMLEFRKVLEKHTGCDVYDWWASEFWNDVAYTGGYEWITNLIKKDYRVIWMDTQRSRILATSPRKNGYDKLRPLKNSRHSQEIVDFRDNIYPTIVDFVKRTNQRLEQEYQRYFIVRLETFENADKTEDPFADLSPHARYLIPCHLDKLCCQLSLNEPYEDEMNADKTRLKKYLSQESINGFAPR